MAQSILPTIPSFLAPNSTTGSGLGSGTAAPTANPSIASGLGVTNSGGVTLNGGAIPAAAAPSPYAAPSQFAGNTATASALTSSLPAIKTTSSGGTSFNPAHATSYATPAPTQNTTQEPEGLGQYLTQNTSSPNGGSLTTQTSNGAPVGYNPGANYSIDTSGTVPSSALSSNTSMNDVLNKQSSYQDYVNALAKAQGYSPQYTQALQSQYAAQTQGAQLGLNSAMLNSNLVTGNNLPGDTESYAQGATAKAQAQNTLQQAENQIQTLGANQALNTATLARSGDIASAQTQLQYSPTGEAGSNAISQYNSLQQAYPGANIPEYNNALTPEQNQQIAQYIVSNSPAYQSQFQSTYATPGGGTGIYSKLNLQGLQQNQDGSYQLVSGAAAALGSAQAGVVNNSLSNLSTINSAIESSTKTLSTTQQFMNQYGLNQTGVPLVTQIENAAGTQIPDKAGAIAALKVDLNTLRSDYSQFLIGRGGSIAGTGPDSSEVTTAIPDNASPAQLQQIVQQMQQGGENTASAVNNQIQQALSGIQSNSVQSNSGGASGGSIYDF